jgi:hypothetical protein
LEELIRRNKEEDDEGDEEEIPTFEQINEMIARSPEELELFQQMDREMFDRERKEEKVQEIIELKRFSKEASRINYRLV